LGPYSSNNGENYGLWSEEGKFITLYPIDQPTAIAGKQNLVEHFGVFKSSVAKIHFSDIEIIQSLNPDRFTARMNIAVETVNNYHYRNQLIWFVAIKDDKIDEILEYYDPIAYNQSIKSFSS
jgi:ketosteroid isomerase-like protein